MPLASTAISLRSRSASLPNSNGKNSVKFGNPESPNNRRRRFTTPSDIYTSENNPINKHPIRETPEEIKGSKKEQVGFNIYSQYNLYKVVISPVNGRYKKRNLVHSSVKLYIVKKDERNNSK